MINLRIHSEFHFDFADRGFGRIKTIAERIKALGQTAGALTDATTYGHIQWVTECEKVGVKPILGAEVRVPLEEGNAKVTLIAKNNEGLLELYALTSLGASDELQLENILKSSKNVIKFTGTLPALSKAELKLLKSGYADVSPSTPPELFNTAKRGCGLPLIATSENRYPSIESRPAFSLFGGAAEGYAQHLLAEREARALMKALPDEAFTLSDKLAKECSVKLPSAVNMEVEGSIEKLCRANIKARLGKWTKRYEARLKFELDMIKSKKFESYFLIISEMMVYAKKHMVVGPARGSAAGSLVCFLLYITDIDPIVHGLMFERFIDVTRNDLPDIDLDFPPDDKRQLVIQHLRDRYGAENVAHLGTIMTLQPKSIIKLVGKRLDIKQWEFQPLLDVMIERSSGDSRGEFCFLDTLNEQEAGRKILARFPQLRTATVFEGHANGSGTHAAGIIVCAKPVRHYCTVDNRTGTAQLDKLAAEKINLLKIDILGLRTLSVFEFTLAQLKNPPDLTKVPLDDALAFKVFNDQKWAGIFQFEGDALQMLQKMITVSEFSDIVAITALGRPGPLNSGGGQEWCDRRMGREGKLEDLHELCSEFTDDTHGIIIFQEQVMQIARKVGQLDWNDVQDIRKTMAKSKGEEAFNKYWDKFFTGAKKQGVSKDAAERIWGHLSTMGAWAFNKSHAVSYALISYWCAYLKAHFPLEFAAATLRYTKGEDQTVSLLRELTEEGVDFVAFDPKTSRENWEVIKGRLTGGYINLKGVGETTARELVKARDSKAGLNDKQRAKVEDAEVLYSNLFPAKARYARLYADPIKHGFTGIRKIWTLRELDGFKANPDDAPSEFFFLGRMVDKVPRDLNEYIFQVKRTQEGRPKMVTKDSAYLNLVIEDDSGKIHMTVSAPVYEEVGREITEKGVVGKSWYLFRGKFNRLKRINITWSKDITDWAPAN